MSTLALILCAGFIAWVYRWDHKNFPAHPRALWVPTLWMMRCGSRGIDYWTGSIGGDRLDPIFVAIILLIGIIILLRRRINWRFIFAQNLALSLFYAYLMISVSWADDLDNPAIKLFRPATDLVMALVVLTDPAPKEAIMAVFRRTAILLIPLSVVLIRYFHDLGMMPAKNWGADIWIGVTTHKNPLGQLCVVAVLAFVWSLAAAHKSGKSLLSRKVEWIYFAMCAYLFNGGGEQDSRSSTAILCGIFGLMIFFVLGRMKPNIHRVGSRLATATVVLTLTYVTMTAFDISPKALVAESQGKSPDLAGRDLIWSETIRLGLENPIFGTGYGGFWVPAVWDKMDPGVDNHPMEAHNGYIEVFANLGLVGVGLMILFVIQTTVGALRTIRTDFEYGRIRLVVIGIVLLMNYSEAIFPTAVHIWWFSFLMVAYSAEPKPNLRGSTSGARSGIKTVTAIHPNKAIA